ncbi:hypothetical protein HY641_01075 [Candidatus Woesearchaeota archaeon]|nr:hypothetical protein [Candidatus Woesearchaeota archaeon]
MRLPDHGGRVLEDDAPDESTMDLEEATHLPYFPIVHTADVQLLLLGRPSSQINTDPLAGHDVTTFDSDFDFSFRGIQHDRHPDTLLLALCPADTSYGTIHRRCA